MSEASPIACTPALLTHPIQFTRKCEEWWWRKTCEGSSSKQESNLCYLPIAQGTCTNDVYREGRGLPKFWTKGGRLCESGTCRALASPGCTKGARLIQIYRQNQQGKCNKMTYQNWNLNQGIKRYEQFKLTNPHHHFVIDVSINQSYYGFVEWFQGVWPNASLITALSPNLYLQKCRITQLLL